MSGLPAMDQAITLRTDSGQDYPSRVESVRATSLTVLCPLDLHTEDRVVAGSTLLATWYVANGIWVLPCQLVAIRREHQAWLWDLDVVGSSWREQRRSFVREEIMGTVNLRWLESHPDATADAQPSDSNRQAVGVIADISEAGLRCVTRDRVLAEHAQAGTKIDVLVKLPGRSLNLRAEITRISDRMPPSGRAPSRATAAMQRSEADAGRWEVVLMFTDPGRVAEELRKVIYNFQLRTALGSRAQRLRNHL